jgi:FixJ family two-component response regulator
MRQSGNFRKSHAGVEPARGKMSSAQVLVVDDDAGHAASVRELLSAHGYSVDFELEGSKGLRRIKAEGVDVLILDLDMPNMSGIDMLQALGTDSNGLKTIVVSGESHVEKITPILRLGAYDYLPKPYEPEQLLASVRNAVSRTQLERENREMLDEKEAVNRRDAFLINASPDLIYMLDVAGRFTFLNDQLRDVFGYQREALIGRDWNALVAPDLRSQLQHHIDERIPVAADERLALIAEYVAQLVIQECEAAGNGCTSSNCRPWVSMKAPGRKPPSLPVPTASCATLRSRVVPRARWHRASRSSTRCS